MEFTEENAQAYVFHSPFNKIVQKSFGRLVCAPITSERRPHSLTDAIGTDLQRLLEWMPQALGGAQRVFSRWT